MSEIFVGLPRGVQGPINLLRSIPHPPHKAHVRFLNRTNTPVSVVWIDFGGGLQDYKILQHDQYFDCNTFVDHAWVFKESASKDPMVVASKEVFWPEPEYEVIGDRTILKRSLAIIERPMNSLHILAARAVRNCMKCVIDPFFVDIPFHLQVHLAQMILEYLDACNRTRPSLPSPLPADNILRRDFDDFSYNTTLICYRLSSHARKLLSFTNKIQGNGERMVHVTRTLNTIIRILRFNRFDGVFDIPMRRLGPVIWRQIIFLRVLRRVPGKVLTLSALVFGLCIPLNPEEYKHQLDNFEYLASHFDTLQSCGQRHNSDFEPSSSYDKLRHMVEERRRLMPSSHRSSLQRYHWDQLSLLVGDPLIRPPENLADSLAYDIPQLLPLDQRTEWRWINLRREQLRDHPSIETVFVFLKYTIDMLQTMDRLESIFQVLCILHFHLTGRHIPDEADCEEV